MALDTFAGSNPTASAVTGSICNLESAISNQAQRGQARRGASAFRFVDELPAEALTMLGSQLHSQDLPVAVNRQQRELIPSEKPVANPAKLKNR